MPTRVASRWIGIALLASASVARAQPVVTLGKPLLQTSAEFTDVSAVRLFTDGTMLVADPGAREFVRVTNRGSMRTVLGRHGAGPNEYESAQQMLTVGRGAYALIDPPQNRWMVFDSVGQFQHTKVFVANESFLRYADFADARGNVYGLGFASKPQDKPESPLVRWTASSAKIDTLSTVSTGDMVAFPMPSDAKGRPAGIAYRFVPYAAADAFAVLPDGGFAIARAATERVEWFDPSGRAIGSTPMPQVPRVPVSDSARAAESSPKVRERIPKMKPLWADNRLNVSPDGFVWIRRARAPSEEFTEILEFSRTVGVTRRLRVPGRAWIVGSAGDRIVMARRTEDELQQLEVYVLPKRAVSASK